MGFIRNSDTLLHAQITREGRRLLYEENEKFIISHFAVSDDGFNYNTVQANDDTDSDAQSIPILEPSTNDANSLRYKLLRYVDDIEHLAKQTINQQIPENEYRIDNQLIGAKVFSLGNWNNDELTITFSMYSPITKKYFLSDGFIIDFGEFYDKYGVVFNFIPIYPSGTIFETNKYWYVSEYIDSTQAGNSNSNIVYPIVVGINNDHKTSASASNVSTLTNDLNIPALTFKLKLYESQVHSIYKTMRANDLTKLEANVIIKNDDKNYIPITNFYGNNKSYQILQTSFPLSITF